MITALIVLGVLLLLTIGLALFVMGIYNGLVALRNRFKNAFSQIDVQLKRRYDLIPNLVETAKAYLRTNEKHSKRSSRPATVQPRRRAPQPQIPTTPARSTR